jgi:hypothetical protein
MAITSKDRKMKTESNQFSDAIGVLENNISENEYTGIPAIASDYCERIRVAIRVLEAAGKVDKEQALSVVGDVPSDKDFGVYGLVSALPDKAKPCPPRKEK